MVYNKNSPVFLRFTGFINLLEFFSSLAYLKTEQSSFLVHNQNETNCSKVNTERMGFLRQSQVHKHQMKCFGL